MAHAAKESGRVGPTHWHLGPVSISPFKHAFVSPEKERPEFPEIYRGCDGGETSAPF
jgi:hypothetical protein